MKKKGIVIDSAGQVGPFTPEQVHAVVARAVAHGDIVATVMRTESGDIAVAAFERPSLELAGYLEQAAAAFRRAVESEEHGGS